MFSRMKMVTILMLGVFFSLASPCFSDEVDMQEKYGYVLMDVPDDAKKAFYDEHKNKWEDSVYSERLLFLRTWEAEVKKKTIRKERLKFELDRQKKEEELKQKRKFLDKQKKTQEEQRVIREKETKKQKEKVRISQKHDELFKKMQDLRNKQARREQDNR